MLADLANGQPLAQPIDSAAIATPTVALASLGFRQGIDFSGLEGRQELFFQVPAGLRSYSLRLVLPFQSVAAIPVARRLTILTRNRVLGTAAIDANGTIDIPIPADAIDGGVLPLTLIYSGAATPNRCYDRRAAADHLHLDPGGGLVLGIARDAVLPIATVAALIGNEPTIMVPARPSTAQAAAALTVIAARGGGRLSLSRPTGLVSYVEIAGEGGPALRATRDNGTAVLMLGGKDPAASARAAFSGKPGWLAGSQIDRLTIRPHRSDTLTFADLGADLGATSIAGEGGWSFAIPASRLPMAQTIAGLAIDVAAVPIDPADSISAWFNDIMLGSAPLDRSGRTRLDVPIPEGSTHSLNGVAVRITRGRRDDCGDTPRGWPAQLLGSSEVRLRAAGPARDFHDFARASHDGVTVVVPGPGALPLAAKVVAGLLDRTVPISVSWGRIPDAGPYILIADAPPPGATPPLGTLDGRLMLTSADGEADFDLPDAGESTVAQLFESGGRVILWIRPAKSGVPQTIWLDQGNVALIAADGVVTPISTVRKRLVPAIVRPDTLPWWDANRRLLMAIAGLLAAIAIAAWSFRPSVKKPRPGQETSDKG
ncbi:hypothetical protein [Sphingomonas sp. UYAg733]